MAGIIVVVGRMQGLTKGHGLIIDKAITASRLNGYQMALLLSVKDEQKKNPLPFNQKLSILELAYGKVGKLIVSNTFIWCEEMNRMRRVCFHYHSLKKTPFSVIELDGNTMDKVKHIAEAYSDVIVMVGGDQYTQFKDLFEKYKDDYPYPIRVMNAGDRSDSDLEDVSSFSASRLRKAAANGDFDEFRKIALEKGDLTARIQYNRLRRAFSIIEQNKAGKNANKRNKKPEVECTE